MAIRSCVQMAVGCALSLSAGQAMANPVTALVGQWTGWGSISTGSGGEERIRCIVAYTPFAGGGGVEQSLKCASASYTVQAVAELRFEAGRVSGTWHERNYAIDGSVSGKADDEILDLSIDGVAFSATMRVTTATCKQSINFTPQGVDIARIDIALARC